jgi:hypothetical protein
MFGRSSRDGGVDGGDGMAGRRGIGPIVALVVLLAVACSGGGGSTTATSATSSDATPEPTRSEYLEAANARCAELNSASLELKQRFESGPQTPDAIAAAMRENAELLQSTVDDLRAIQQPAGDEATLEEILDEAARLAPLVRQLAVAADHRDQATFDAVAAEGNRVMVRVNEAFDAYGLVECAKSADDLA